MGSPFRLAEQKWLFTDNSPLLDSNCSSTWLQMISKLLPSMHFFERARCLSAKEGLDITDNQDLRMHLKRIRDLTGSLGRISEKMTSSGIFDTMKA